MEIEHPITSIKHLSEILLPQSGTANSDAKNLLLGPESDFFLYLGGYACDEDVLTRVMDRYLTQVATFRQKTGFFPSQNIVLFKQPIERETVALRAKTRFFGHGGNSGYLISRLNTHCLGQLFLLD